MNIIYINHIKLTDNPYPSDIEIQNNNNLRNVINDEKKIKF